MIQLQAVVFQATVVDLQLLLLPSAGHRGYPEFMTSQQAIDIIAQEAMPGEKVRLSPSDDVSFILTDSLDFIWGVQQIEKRIGKELPNEELVECKTVGDLAACIVRHAV